MEQATSTNGVNREEITKKHIKKHSKKHSANHQIT